jgi:5-formyltetrahydrofolate cyclo-ligase
MTKAEIRGQVAGQKASIGLPILESHSLAALKRFQRLEIYHHAKTIGAYVPMPDEIDVTPIMIKPERTFYIPAFDEALGGYRLARMGETFRRGRFGILEPVDPVFAEQDELDLIIVPGIAFDRAGRRVGRGGGFYDRLLPLYKAPRIGLCFDFQIVETVPAEEHDISMDLVITDTQIFKVPMNN